MNISSLDLNLLLVLDAVLQERSVARAAKRLHVTAPAISNALARLRTHLNDPLFVRSGRGIVPTPRALRLGPSVARALKEIEQALHGDSFDPASCTNRFTLAVADAGQQVRVPRLAAQLAIEMPWAQLRVIGVDSLHALGGLASADIDAVIGVSDEAPGVHVEPLVDEPTTLIVRAKHPEIGARITRAQLASLGHVAVEMAPGRAADQTAIHYKREGIERRVAVITPTFTAALAVVAATDLIATVPVSLCEAIGKKLGVRAVRSPLSRHTVQLKLCWHERTHHDPAMAAFRALIKSTARSARSGPERRHGRDALPEGAGAGGRTKVTRPKRLALWKFPCPRIGDQATPPFCFIA